MSDKGIGSCSWFPSTTITAKKQYHSGNAEEEEERKCTTINQNTKVTQIRGNGNIQWARVLSLQCSPECNFGVAINRARQTSIADCTQAGKNSTYPICKMNIADSLSRDSTYGYIEHNIVRKNGKRWSDDLTSWMIDCTWIVNQMDDRHLHRLRLGNDCQNESTYNTVYTLHVWMETS